MAKHSASRRWPAGLAISALATVLGTVLALVVGAETAFAASNITNVSVTGTSQRAGAVTSWTAGFRTDTPAGSALGTGDQVVVTFASGFTIATTPPVTLGAGFTSCTATASRTSTLVVTVTLAGASCSLPKSTSTSVTLGSITNPAAGSYAGSSFSVSTNKDSAGSPGSSVVIFGNASKLAITTPAGATGGTAFSTQPVVTVQDSGGRTVADDTSSVTLAITSGTGTAGATLSCTSNPLASVAGVATFAGCKIDKAGTGYTLTATDGTLSSAVSGSFAVTVGAPSKLAFSQQPATGTAGSVLGAFKVTVQDAGGNTTSATTGSTDTLALSIATGPAGATTSVTAVAGVATFGAITLNTAGNYTFTAADTSRTGVSTATSSPATAVSAAAASKLAFVQGPTDLDVGSAFSPAITVQVQDQFGNAVSSSGLTATLSSSAGPLDAGSTASTGGSGLASFGSAQINTAAAGLTLTAAASGLTSATSGSFNVVVPVTNGIPLTDTAADTGSGVKSVSYYYCSGYAGACTNGTLVGTATNPVNNYQFSWTGQPANGQYRLVAVAIDNVTNTSLPSTSIPIRIAN
jgi:hypothetical protein